MASDKSDFSIIIVGAGPAGMLLAVLLARKHINVTVLEKSSEFDKQPRASFYSTPAIYEFKRAGVFEDILAKSLKANGISWRHLDGSHIASIIADDVAEEDRLISLPLDELIPLLGEHLDRLPSAKVLFQHEVQSIGQDEHQAWVEVSSPSGTHTMKATYIVGCDGGSSKIRRELFGRDFPGMTWDKQLVATNTYYPGLSKAGWERTTNFMAHPEHFHMIAQIKNDGLLRITYGEDVGLTLDEMVQRQPEKFKTFLPGHPDEDEYKIVNFSPYKIHQRIVDKMVRGRFILAADAAHICNPFGGLGLTGGLADVGGLYDCLYGIFSAQADESILEKYSEIRREKYLSVIDPESSQNFKRLWNPETLEQDPFIQMVKRAETDREYAKEVFGGTPAVMHDFTQYYR